MLRKPIKQNNIHRFTNGHQPVRTDNLGIKAANLRRVPPNTIYPEHGLVINLKRSPERLQNFRAANTFSGTMEVIEAVDGLLLPPSGFAHLKQGDLGCLLSHKKALEYAKEKNWDCVLIFEDDVRFTTDFNERLKQAMSELPDTWDMLWLAGAQRFASIDYSPHLKLMGGAWGAYAYILRNTVYDFFLSEFAKGDNSSDTYYSEHHKRFNSFRIVPDLLKHSYGSSDRILTNQAK